GRGGALSPQDKSGARRAQRFYICSGIQHEFAFAFQTTALPPSPVEHDIAPVQRTVRYATSGMWGAALVAARRSTGPDPGHPGAGKNACSVDGPAMADRQPRPIA